MRQMGQAAAVARADDRRTLISELIKYGLASAAALAVDWGLLIVLTERLGMHYLASATIGFLTGLSVAYILSVAFVFRSRRLADPRAEFALFCLVGLAGLGLTHILLRGMVDFAGMNYALAKGPTAGLVFLFNFTARRALLFSAANRA